MTDIENKDKVTKTEEEWRQMLSAEEFEVTRRAGTERPFTGVYWNEERDGKYMCKCSCSVSGPTFSSASVLVFAG